MEGSSERKVSIFRFVFQQIFFLFPCKKSPINTQHFILRQIAFLLPLFLTVIVVSFYCKSEEPVDFFRQSRESHKMLYNSMVAISSGNIVGYILYGFCLVWALVTKKTLNAWFVFYYIAMQVMIGVFVVYTLKISVGRARPFTGKSEYDFFTMRSSHHSFPSGHVTEICGAIGPFAQRAYPFVCAFLWGLLPAAIGFSRIYLGKHHRTDVLVGSLIGSVTTYAIMHFWLIKKEQIEKNSRLH